MRNNLVMALNKALEGLQGVEPFLAQAWRSADTAQTLVEKSLALQVQEEERLRQEEEKKRQEEEKTRQEEEWLRQEEKRKQTEQAAAIQKVAADKAAAEKAAAERPGHTQGPLARSSEPAATQWVKHFDEEYQTHFWSNTVTGDSTWEDPTPSAAPAPASVWTRHFDEEYQAPFWTHNVTGDSTWETPDEIQALGLAEVVS